MRSKQQNTRISTFSPKIYSSSFINFVPQINAINPYLALCPIIFILAVTAVKDGYEDSRRRKSDKGEA
jgi:hypothetical protein